MEILLLILFVVVAALVLVITSKKKIDKLDTNAVTVEVTLVDKIKEDDHYYLVFSPNVRDTIKLEVIDSIYHDFYLGCEGILTYKEDKYIDFAKTK